MSGKELKKKETDTFHELKLNKDLIPTKIQTFLTLFQLLQQGTHTFVCLSACGIEENTLSHKAVDIATTLDVATESLALADVERDFEL